ncbi:PP2C-domain-containing protein [Gigaspora margarita]|uniref:protein-serine/threonine phosphatase n=1 Tax=Gigaspora margarita TaxID=4874 RepID=A0A8H4AY55_GIGMA|nr:PP2C-domain-containing protein [Gigaspora margarita]
MHHLLCKAGELAWKTHTATLKLLDKKGYSYFGVYDGESVAKYCGNNLHTRIAKDAQFETNLVAAIQNGFLGTDDDLKNDSQFQNDSSGCAAVMAIVTPNNEIYVGNAGNSRAVLSEDGIACQMSDDHKPINPGESKRIQDAGGFVEFGKVNAYPDVKMTETKFEATEFLILACDGIWDCLSSQDVVSFIRKNISENKDLR